MNAAAKRVLRGTVSDENTGARFTGATLRLEGKEAAPAFSTTDDDGDFEFDLSDATRWPDGEYGLSAFAPAARILGDGSKVDAPLKIVLDAAKPEIDPIDVRMIPDQESSEKVGWGFVGVLIVLLLGLFWLYLHLHQKFPNAPVPLSTNLTVLLERTIAEAETTQAFGRDATVRARLGQAEAAYRAFAETAGAETLPEDRKSLAATLFADAASAADATATAFAASEAVGEAADEAAKAKALSQAEMQRLRLLDILATLQQVTQSAPGYFWDTEPKRLGETLLWALAATLIRLLFDASRYVRNRNFHWRAIPQHLAFIVTVPVLAVIMAFVLSLVQISINLSDIGLELSLDNIAISIVIAALIGLAPWKTWDFLHSLADLVFEKLAGLTGKSG